MSDEIIKVSSTPNDIGNLWRPRTQEFTGGFNGREMGNYGDLDVNPNENADGLSHHTRQTLKMVKAVINEIRRKDVNKRCKN